MYKVILHHEDKQYIKIKEKTSSLPGSEVELKIGNQVETVKVKAWRQLGDNSISIPNHYGNGLVLPDDVPFEVKLEQGKVEIGPVIGILGCRRKKELTPELLQLVLMRFQSYESVNGLIFIFTEDGVMTSKRMIEGYYYSPSEKKWKQGVFPYPCAIFVNKSSMSPDMYNHFVSVIGPTVFYSQHIPKWQQYQLLSKDQWLKRYLPHTIPFTGMKSLMYMISLYGYVYFKPNQSYQGFGMYSIKLGKQGYMVKNEFNQEFIFQSGKKLYSFLMKNMQSRYYLIQKSVPYHYKNRNVDFRVYLQKDRNKKWVSPGITTKISKEGSIITNSRNRAGLIEAADGLKQLYLLSNTQSKKIQRKMVMICIAAAKLIESEGIHLGDVAFDVIVDAKLNIWLLELQGGYSVEKKKGEIPEHIFQKLLTTPFEYAKTLAGF
ncbi:hypothetical protein FZW96_15070 [Bacillus sp. BGMRC 2118]|nr:hypothetical protein FZW96_15070 [Bacillus sp. BGMRC 2118]